MKPDPDTLELGAPPGPGPNVNPDALELETPTGPGPKVKPPPGAIAPKELRVNVSFFFDAAPGLGASQHTHVSFSASLPTIQVLNMTKQFVRLLHV